MVNLTEVSYISEWPSWQWTVSFDHSIISHTRDSHAHYRWTTATHSYYILTTLSSGYCCRAAVYVCLSVCLSVCWHANCRRKWPQFDLYIWHDGSSSLWSSLSVKVIRRNARSQKVKCFFFRLEVEWNRYGNVKKTQTWIVNYKQVHPSSGTDVYPHMPILRTPRDFTNSASLAWLTFTSAHFYIGNVYIPVGVARALTDSSDFGLLGE